MGTIRIRRHGCPFQLGPKGIYKRVRYCILLSGKAWGQCEYKVVALDLLHPYNSFLSSISPISGVRIIDNMTRGNYNDERATCINKVQAPAGQGASPDLEKQLSQQLEQMSQLSWHYT
jgi:hypothetical protein